MLKSSNLVEYSGKKKWKQLNLYIYEAFKYKDWHINWILEKGVFCLDTSWQSSQ